MLQGPLPEAGGFCFRPSAQRAGLAGNIPGGLPSVIRLGGPFNQSLNVASRHTGLFCFRPSAQRAGLAGNIPGGLPPVIRLGGPFNQSLNVASRHSGLFCFRPSAQRAGFGRKQKIPGTSCSGIG